MAVCKKCSAQFEDINKFCPNCGAPVEDQAAGQQTDFAAKLGELTNTADTTDQYDPQDIANNKVFAILAYFGLLVLIPIFAAKESKFARFHANQGLVLFVASLAWAIVSSILGLIPVVDIIVGLLGWVVSLIIFILAVIGLINACQGKAKEVPIVGKYTLIK